MSIVSDLDDLCDFTKVSQKWKQQKYEAKQATPSPTKTETENSLMSSKTNPWNKENSLPNSNEEIKKLAIQPKVRSHAPQIIDEDTEHFKLKLEHLLNVFKTEATSEFMQMKRSMLDDQKQTIKGETERYLQMYEQKSNELTQHKEQLADSMRHCQVLIERTETISALYGKLKLKGKHYKLLQCVFKDLKKYSLQRRQKRKNLVKAQQYYKKCLKKQAYKLLVKDFNISIRESIKLKMKKEQQVDLDQIIAKFSKDQQLLEFKLADANQQLDEANKIKIGMQDNLKRAFMKGVCALNFEAMNVLNGSTPSLDIDQFGNGNGNNKQFMNGLESNINETLLLNESHDMVVNRGQSPPSPSKNLIKYNQNQQRMDTIEHKWKDAPLMGIKQTSQQIQNLNDMTETQSAMLSISKLVQQDDNDLDCEEQSGGKIIKVNFDTQVNNNKKTGVKQTIKPQPQPQKQIVQKKK